eukprot:6907038-Ditylum_brightwellii.AAC.1
MAPANELLLHVSQVQTVTHNSSSDGKYILQRHMHKDITTQHQSNSKWSYHESHREETWKMWREGMTQTDRWKQLTVYSKTRSRVIAQEDEEANKQ